MKFELKLLLFPLLLVLEFAFLNQALAQVIPVGTGSPTGSYFKFVSQAAQSCKAEAQVSPVETAGSTENLDGLENNTFALGISQLDILDLYRRTRDMSNIKVLVPLFPEQVHFLTRGDVTKLEGQKTLLGIPIFKTGTRVQLSTVSDLAGKTVVAAGGSAGTARVISILGGISWNLREVKTADQAVTEVAEGKADAAILVGAQPLGTILQLKENQAAFRLLPVSDDLISKLSSVYVKSQPLVYRAMGAGGDSVQTVHVMSALMTQNYPKSAMGDAVYRFQQCLLRIAPDQATVVGSHPAWRNLRSTAGVNWEIWRYSGASTASTPAAPAKK